MDPYMAMMGTEELDKEKLRMLADQLRGGSATGARLSTSSLEPIQNQGRLMQTQADTRARDIGLQQSRREAQKAAEARDASRQSQLDQKRRFSMFSGSFTENLRDQAMATEETMALIGRFGSNEFAGDIPLMGKAENWLVGKAPSLFSDEKKRSTAWWKDWNNYYNNPTRNKLFGSALTAAEQRAWDSANIHPDMSDEEITLALGTLADVVKKRSLADLQTVRTQGMPEEFSQSIYQDILNEDEFADPSSARTALQQRLSDPNYRVGERGLADKEDGRDLESMSLEELRALRQAMGE